MAEKSLHIIDKLEYRITGNSVAGSNQLQQQISAMHKEKLQEVMNRCFDRFFPAGRHLRLQKLEVNIGKIPEKNFERQFLSAFEEQLVSELQALAKQEKVAVGEVSSKWKSGRQRGTTARDSSVAQADWELLVHFFTTGKLGWWVPLHQKPDIEALLLKFFDGLEKSSQKQIRQQLLELLSEKQALQRIVQQLSFPALQRLLAFTADSPQLQIPALSKITAFEKRKILMASLEMIAKENLPFTADIFYVAFLTEAISSQSGINKKKFTKEIIKYLPEALAKKFTKLSEEEIANLSLGKILQQINSQEKGKQPEKSSQKKLHKQKEEKDTDAGPEEGLVVHNAGIVLLWPYFSRFFTNTGLLENKQFADESKKASAAYYLHYLATGNTHAYEYELLLNKVLCGLPLNFPLQREFEIPDELKIEAENLLLSFIRYWSALKSTSPQGLQQAFLTRPGKLYFKEKSCTIRIERSGIDVLIDKLPHGLSLIRLPWLKKIIYTEW